MRMKLSMNPHKIANGFQEGSAMHSLGRRARVGVAQRARVVYRVCASVCVCVRHVARSNVAFIARKFCIFLLARFFHALHSLFFCLHFYFCALSFSLCLCYFPFSLLLSLAFCSAPFCFLPLGNDLEQLQRAAASSVYNSCISLAILSLSPFPLLPSHPFPTLPPSLPAAPSIVPNVPSHHVGRSVASGVLKNVIDLFPSQL